MTSLSLRRDELSLGGSPVIRTEASSLPSHTFIISVYPVVMPVNPEITVLVQPIPDARADYFAERLDGQGCASAVKTLFPKREPDKSSLSRSSEVIDSLQSFMTTSLT